MRNMKKETQCKHEEVMTVFSGGGDNNPITSCVRCHAFVVPKDYELPRDLKKIVEGEKPNVYVIQENIGKCKMCGKKGDLRMGWCFDCVEAQNILAVGKEMLEDEGVNDIKFPIKEVNRRLKMLLERGWVKLKNK